jgi:hypothetical protein
VFLLLTSLAHAAERACVPRDLAVLEHEAREHLFQGEFEAALEPPRQAEESLACLQQLAHPGQLSGIFQAGAAAALQLEQDALAQRWYETAHRLGPGESFDADLAGDQGRALWEATGENLASAGQGEIVARSDLRLDGWALTTGERREVYVGEHLVQFLDAEGEVVSQLAPVSAGAELQAGPRPSPPFLLAGGGAALSAAGLVALNLGVRSAFVAGAAQHEGASQAELDRQGRRTNALLIGGSVAVGAGTGALVTGLLAPGRTRGVRSPASGQE